MALDGWMGNLEVLPTRTLAMNSYSLALTMERVAIAKKKEPVTVGFFTSNSNALTLT